MLLCKNTYLPAFVAFIWSLPLVAQEPDSVIALREVAIIATPVRQASTASFNENISPAFISDYSSRPVSELLARSTALIINEYGPGGLATVSLRGAGSSQTAIIWNGLNLQSPMNGGINLSQIPVSFIDNIEVNHGGQGAQQGNSAIGGVLQLTSKAENPIGFAASITQSVGSYGNYFSGLKFRYGCRRWSLSTRLFHQTSRNDFTFINTARYGRPDMKQPNAALLQYGFLQTGLLQINQQQQLIVRVWAQHYDKQIPPIMTNLDSRQRQVDRDLRLAAEWKGVSGKFQWIARSGYLYNKQRYSDPASALEADNRAASWQNNLEGLVHINPHHRIIFQTGTTLETGQSDNYNGLKKRNLTWLMAGYRLALTDNKAVFSLNVREELTDLKFTVPTFSVGTDVVLWPLVSLHTNFARSYRVPTLNDLYWNIWGNPNLKPEQGFTFDAGLNLKKKSTHWLTDASLTLFSNHINDWIIWLPKGSIWTPENLKRVWSRGVESQITTTYSHDDLALSLMAKYNYTRAAQLATDRIAADESLQLIYTPEHKASASFSVAFKGFDLRFDHSVTGQRFADAANTATVAGYSVSDLSAGKILNYRKWQVETRLRINNLTDRSYQTIAWYAMPGRNIQVSMMLSFN